MDSEGGGLCDGVRTPHACETRRSSMALSSMVRIALLHMAVIAANLQTDYGKTACLRRKWIAEPPNGRIESVLGFRQFVLRRLHRVQAEFKRVRLALMMTWIDDCYRESIAATSPFAAGGRGPSRAQWHCPRGFSVESPKDSLGRKGPDVGRLTMYVTAQSMLGGGRKILNSARRIPTRTLKLKRGPFFPIRGERKGVAANDL